jgi:hypothetical protein
MADELEMRPIVARIFWSLERIRKLAAGVILRDQPQPMAVPRTDMEDALALAENIAETIKNWAQRVQFLRTLGWGGLVSEISYGIAESGADGILRTISNRLERPKAREIEPISISVLITYDFRIFGSRDVLLVLSGELTWNESPLSAISRSFNNDVNAFTANATDIFISMLPVIGPIYDIATGVLGVRLPDAQRLTNTERVLRIVFVGAGAIFGLLIKGTRVTARTLVIMRAGKQAQVLRTSLGQMATFRALAVSVAKMTPKNAQIILEIVSIVRKGGLPTIEQMNLFYSFFHALNQTATAAHWAVLVKNPANISGKVGSVTVLNHVVHKKGEKEALEALSKNLPEAEIVALPALSPNDFEKVTKGLTGSHPVTGKPVLSTTEHLKHPDFALEGSLGDIYTPEGANIKKIMNTIASKSSQASTVVVNIDFTTLTAQELIQKMPKAWGSPYGMSLRRVIVLDSKGFFQVITRPSNFQLPQLFAFPIQTLANLRETWAGFEKDEAAEAAAAAQ